MKNTVCTALMLLMSVCMYAQELYGEYEKKCMSLRREIR